MCGFHDSQPVIGTNSAHTGALRSCHLPTSMLWLHGTPTFPCNNLRQPPHLPPQPKEALPTPALSYPAQSSSLTLAATTHTPPPGRQVVLQRNYCVHQRRPLQPRRALHPVARLHDGEAVGPGQGERPRGHLPRARAAAAQGGCCSVSVGHKVMHTCQEAVVPYSVRVEVTGVPNAARRTHTPKQTSVCSC